MKFDFAFDDMFDLSTVCPENQIADINEIDFASINEALSNACDFFGVDTPDVDIESPITGITTGDSSILSDDILGVNISELQQFGLSDTESLSLVFTHEMAHRGLQGCEGIDSWAEESACDFMSGVMAGMNDMNINGYIEKVEELPPNMEHPYGFIRAEFVKMGMEYANNMAERGCTPTFEQCMTELNYRYSQLQPYIDEIRKDIDAHNDIILQLITIYKEQPDAMVAFDGEMLADPCSPNHKIMIVDESTKGFVQDVKSMSPVDLALLNNDLIYDPKIWEERANGNYAVADSLSISKYQKNIHDIYHTSIDEIANMKRLSDFSFEMGLQGLDPDQILELSEFKKKLDAIPINGERPHHVTPSEYIINKLKSIEIPSIPYPKILTDIKNFFTATQPESPKVRTPHPDDIILA